MVVVPFVAVEGANDSTAAKFTALVTEELKKRGDALEVASPPSVKPPPSERLVGTKTTGPSQQALAALDAGKRSFEELRFEDAVKELKQGVDGLLADPATADFEVILDADTKLAAAYFRMGEEKDAKTALNDLARLSPTFTLPAGFPPVFQRELEKAKKRLDKQPRGQVAIDGPAGATAFIDGRDLGMVPVLEEGIPAGTHYVKVEGTRGEKWGQAVVVKGELVKAKAVFAGAAVATGGERSPVNNVPSPNITNPLDEGMRDRLAAFTRAAGADLALVAVVYRASDVQVTAGPAVYQPQEERLHRAARPDLRPRRADGHHRGLQGGRRRGDEGRQLR